MTDSKNLTRFDRMSIAMAISEDLKPEILECLQHFGKDFLDHVAVGYHNSQAQKLREYREDRQRREHRDQRRFISNQDVPDPTIPPGGAVNDLRVELNEVKVALNQVLKKLDAFDKRHDRFDEQLAYAHRSSAWLTDDETEEEEVEIPDD